MGPAVAAPQLRLSPESGPPGTHVTVTGTGFQATEIVIHWGSEDGPELARATGPEFSVPAVVPDAPANSHQVYAVIRDGNAVSTSSAPFQVTPAEVVTTTTVAEAVTTTTAARRGTPAAGNDRQTSGVGGGAEDMSDTVGGSSGGQPSAAGSGGATTTTTAPEATARPADPDPDPAQASPLAASPQPPAGAPVDARPGPSGEPGEAATALGQRQTSQSSGAVGNTALLALGLGMVFFGGAFLAIRNRHRPPA